ncbi:MAG TPA: SIMPL domain-containing protein [Longimicrobiaceae bacterium]|nr:SIMPL domain-containing protein [Longimicrobiaceae bacterium]
MRMTRSFAAAAMTAALLTMGAGAAVAQPAPRAPHTIRVSATGESRATPDRAWVDVGVETEAATARAAAEENARKMEAVVAALLRAGVARDDVQTRDYNVFPVYEANPRGEGEPRLRGYRVANTVSARTDDVRRVGALIDAALAAGANRVNSVRFGLRDPDRARAEALGDALRRARAEATVIAAGLQVQLGNVLDASAGDAPPPMPMAFRREAMAADMASTPIEPGQQTVTATVSVVYEISP